MHGYKLVYEGEDSPKGKFWNITPFEDGSGLWIEYGPMGKKPRTALVPKAKCIDGVLLEMEKRYSLKIAEGYVCVDSEVPAKAVVATNAGTDADVKDPPANKTLAYVSYESTVDFADFQQRVTDHLLSIFTPEVAGGTTEVTPTHDGVQVKISRPKPQDGDEFELRLKIGCTLHEDDELTALCMASIATAFPNVISLADADGEPMIPRELADMIAGDHLEVQERFRISSVVSLGRAQPLGTWFF